MLRRWEIGGKVFVVCDVPPEQHHLDVRLEVRSGAQWISMATVTSDKPPSSRGDFYLVSFVGCQPGDWRTHAIATGQLGDRPFHFEDTSQVTTITRDDCERARKRAG